MQDVEGQPGSKDTTPPPASPEETTASQKPDGRASESEGEGAEVQESEGELEGKKGESGKRKVRSDTDGDEPDPASKPARKRPASKRGASAKNNRKRTSVVVDSDGDLEDAKASRYKSVSTSTLHTSWDHSILDLIRKEFQLALLARDGFPAKVSSLDRPKNLKQLLVSAKKVLDKTVYTKFKNQVDAAFQDTSKE